MNRRLSYLPCVTGVSHGLFGDSEASIKAMTEAVNEAEVTVHVEFFITAWDDTTDILMTALADAVKRGVRVRLLYDDVASRRYPGFKEMNSRLTAVGIEWHEMMPIKPFKGKWRRPDLRNHRKLLVVDSKVAFMGSQNMIDASYDIPKNIKIGRRWKDLNIKISGEIVTELEAVFAMDWYTETGERLGTEIEFVADPDGDVVPMQLLPSGPGYLTMPNLRLFSGLVHRAQQKLSLTSPYFVPDDSCWRRSPRPPTVVSRLSCSYPSRPTSSWSKTPKPRTMRSCWRRACESTNIPSRLCCTPSTSPSTTSSASSARAIWTTAPSDWTTKSR